ncbi:MAG TPA: AI-2E family transporter [Dehalococcoidia bacterium]|jgi:predicted PurR-regulated permease PerM|nr:AI-2E family transporter [Dehalococcoidia bacterium]
MTSTLRKHWRLAALLLGAVIILWVLYLLRTAILPFVLGLVLAYLLLPIISWLEGKLPRPRNHPDFKRVISIAIVFLTLFALIAGFSYFIVTAVIEASLTLAESAPYFIGKSLFQIQEWLDILRQQVPPEVRQQVDKALIDAGIALGNSIREAFIKGISSMPQTFSVFLGLAALPLFLFYLLKDSEKLKDRFYNTLPSAAAEHVRNLACIVERVLGRYIRAQLMLGLIVAYFTFIGLLILEIPFALVLAILAGVGELIPTLGPWISGAVVAIVTLALAPEKVLWVILLFLVIQLFENSLLVPRIQGGYLRLHPALMIFLLVLGAYLAGFWGLLLAGPLTATGIEIYHYIRRHYEAENTDKPPE